MGEECQIANVQNFIDFISTHTHTQLSIPHQWLEGNLPTGSKCMVCERACGSVRRLQDYRCMWCKLTVSTYSSTSTGTDRLCSMYTCYSFIHTCTCTHWNVHSNFLSSIVVVSSYLHVQSPCLTSLAVVQWFTAVSGIVSASNTSRGGKTGTVANNKDGTNTRQSQQLFIRYK